MTSTKGHPYTCHRVCVLSIKRWDMFKKKFRLTTLGLVFDAVVYFNHLTVKRNSHCLFHLLSSLVNITQMDLKQCVLFYPVLISRVSQYTMKLMQRTYKFYKFSKIYKFYKFYMCYFSILFFSIYSIIQTTLRVSKSVYVCVCVCVCVCVYARGYAFNLQWEET